VTVAGPAPTTRLAWADAAKGLLIVLVVFWHVVMKSYLTIDWRIGLPIPGAWGLISDLAYPVRMPLFFLISGCFAANAVARPWAAVFRSRVLRFLYLYLLWTLIHMVTMWAFPDFPTLIRRSVAEFVEAITISPPNAWYLYALALYFLVAKALRRLPAWIPLAAAAALTTAVGAGLIDVVSNRGSLLANLLYFLIGTTFSRWIIGSRPAAPSARASSVALYLGAFAVVRATGWSMFPECGGGRPPRRRRGDRLAPLLARVPRLGRALARLGRRTLQIYVIHMPVLALADALVAQRVSDAGRPVQLVAAVLLPVVLTAVVIAVSVGIGALVTRDRLSWLFDLPAGAAREKRSPSLRESPPVRRLPWRTPPRCWGSRSSASSRPGRRHCPPHPRRSRSGPRSAPARSASARPGTSCSTTRAVRRLRTTGPATSTACARGSRRTSSRATSSRRSRPTRGTTNAGRIRTASPSAATPPRSRASRASTSSTSRTTTAATSGRWATTTPGRRSPGRGSGRWAVATRSPTCGSATSRWR
jgi:uncharacterized membrane protein YcfT